MVWTHKFTHIPTHTVPFSGCWETFPSSDILIHKKLVDGVEMCSITVLLCTILIRNWLYHFLNAQSNHTPNHIHWLFRQAIQHMGKKINYYSRRVQHITVALLCGSIMMLLMNNIHSSGSIERERKRGGKDGVVSIWPADMFRACGLWESASISEKQPHTHTHTISTVPQGLKLLVQDINLKPQEKSST